MQNPVLYHYTNPSAFESMRTGSVYRKSGLIPIKRLVPLCVGRGLPDEAHDGAIFGLFEPEPKSWLEHKKFNNIWNYLMNSISRESETILLKVDLLPSDNAYVVDRAHIEKALYSNTASQKKLDYLLNKAYSKYWESRVPVLEYEENYSLPELTVWSPIEFNRLQVVWTKKTNDVCNKVQELTKTA